jgi:UDP-glucose 4-epimerase
MRTQSALITGAGGFIGSHLTEQLLALGWRLTTTTRNDSPDTRCLLERTECLRGPLSDLLSGDLLARDFDYIFHLAGSANVPMSIADPLADMESNAGLSLKLLERVRASNKRPKILYVSSAAVYGNPSVMPITEESPFNPISPYAVSKLASEQYMRVYAKLHSVPTVILRPFSVYGQRQRKLVVFDLLEQLRQPGDVLRVHGNGSESRDFIHVDDMVQAMITIAEKGQFIGEAYNLASGRTVTIRELAELLLATSGEQRRIEYTGERRPGEPLNWEVDISKLRALGFQPRIELSEGLRSLGYRLTATKL